MGHRDEVLSAKSRLTTVKGYAQLIEREILRMDSGSHTELLLEKIRRLNAEIRELTAIILELERQLADDPEDMWLINHRKRFDPPAEADR